MSDPVTIDVGLLALFVGQAANERVARQVEADGFTGLRISHGYLFQHLVDGPKTVGELARLQGVSQQAVSKVVAELRRSGYLDLVPGDDARTRPVALSLQGRGAVESSRRARAAFQSDVQRLLGDGRAQQLERDLWALLEDLGGDQAVRRRRVRQPS